MLRSLVFPCFLLAYLISFGQYSGNYTINRNIPASTTNFISFSAMADSLQLKGISGSVTISVEPGSGPYLESFTLNAVPGHSVINTITIEGNNNIIQDTSTGTRLPVIRLIRMTHVTLRNMIIKSIFGNFYSEGISITDSSSNNIIEQCKIESDLSASPTVYGIRIGNFSNDTSISTCHDNVIKDNHITGGSSSIFIAGDTNSSIVSGNTVIRNTLINFKTNGIFLLEGKNDNIEQNNISRLNRGDSTWFRGIFLLRCSGTSIHRNKIHNSDWSDVTDQSYGIHIRESATTVSSPIKVYNNIIYGFDKVRETNGIRVESASNIEIHYNTIYFDQYLNTQYTSGIYLAPHLQSSSNVNITNNIVFLNRNGFDGKNTCLAIGDTFPTITSNYNILYAGTKNYPNNNIVARWRLTEIKSMLGWKMFQNGRFDQQSDSANPEFLFLPLDSLVPNSAVVNDMGSTISWITSDYNGNPRSATPDPGAFEFTPFKNDAGFIDNTVYAHCPGVITVPFTVYNNGTDTLRSFDFNWQAGGGTTMTKSVTCSLGFSDTITVFTLPLTNTYKTTVKAWVTSPNGNADQFSLNDTLLKIVHTGLDGNYTINSAQPDDTTNFNTFGSMAYALSNFGVCGPVVIRVVPGSGPYNEMIRIDSIFGASAVNTITLNGSMDTLRMIQAGRNNVTLFHLNGSDYFHLDSLILHVPDDEITSAIRLTGSSNYNTISNSRILIDHELIDFNAPHNGITLENSFQNRGVPAHNIISKNIIRGGNHGIVINKISDSIPDFTIIESNEISHFRHEGIRMDKSYKSITRYNTIYQDSFGSSHEFHGIFVFACKDLQIIANEIAGRATGEYCWTAHGIYVTQTIGTALGEGILIANNIVHHIRSIGLPGYCSGIECQTSGCNIYHNTIYLRNSQPYGSAMNGVYLLNGIGNLRNNLIDIENKVNYHTNVIGIGDNTTNHSSDYNGFFLNLSNTGKTHMGIYNGTYHNTLSSWQAIPGESFDLNSIVTDPMIYPGSYAPHAPGIDNLGDSLGVLTDFYGNIRDLHHPDLGAIEFTADSINVGVSSIPNNLFGSCTDSIQLLQATVFNHGSQKQYNVPVYFIVKDSVRTKLFSTTIDSISPGSSAFLTIDTIHVDTGGVLFLTAYTAQPGDQYPDDDTTYSSTSFLYEYPVTPLINDTTVCPGSKVLFKPSNLNEKIMWFISSSATTPFLVDTFLLKTNLQSTQTVFTEAVPISAQCPGARSSFTITVDIVTATISVSNINGRNYQFQAITSGTVNNHLWNFGDGDTSSLANPVHEYLNDGVYDVKLSAGGNCDTITTIKELEVGAVGIEIQDEINGSSVHIYPNPANRILNVQLTNEYSKIVTAGIYDMPGHLLIEQSPQKNTASLKISDLKTGTYFMIIRDDLGNTYNRMIIIN